MASGLYDKGREGFLDGSINWSSGDIRTVLVRSAYSVNLATHQFVSDITTGNENGRSATLGTKTVTAGVADAADTTITATAAAASNALVVFQHTGTDATARLIAYIDTATGLPFTPAVSQVVPIAWDNGANKIFKL
jgi:hypothetical protein